jgi:hypothetical protein
LRRYALPVGLELTPLRFDTTPMSSEVHGNGLGGRRQSRRGDPLGGFAVIDVHDFPQQLRQLRDVGSDPLRRVGKA